MFFFLILTLNCLKFLTLVTKDMYFNLLMNKDYSSSSSSSSSYYYYYYLTGFAKTWVKKFQVHSNKLTSKWNGKQLKVTS